MKPEAGDQPTLEVLYEDNHLIAVCKPAGLLTQADQSGQPNLLDELKHWLAVRYAKPGNVFLGMLHRLDRPVTGVVLFAKTSKAASRLSEQFRQRSVTKIYLARVHGVMRPAKGRLVHFHRHDEGERAVRLFDTPSANTKSASLIYETRWVDHGESVLEVQLETGRKHQIRAQLAQVGHPILGDALYGSQRQHLGAAAKRRRPIISATVSADAGPIPNARISLCALQLTFEHPIHKAPVSVCLPAELVPPELRSNS